MSALDIRDLTRDEAVSTGLTVLAIDPGDVQSAFAVVDADTRRPLEFDKVDNHLLRERLVDGSLAANWGAVEMISSYGMPVGKEVFETCVWIGRFIEASGCGLNPVLRREVKLHHCRTTKATDANISAALKDRFASGVSNHGKGTRDNPGFFYGFKADVWQAYALAVQQADLMMGYEP